MHSRFKSNINIFHIFWFHLPRCFHIFGLKITFVIASNTFHGMFRVWLFFLVDCSFSGSCWRVQYMTRHDLSMCRCQNRYDFIDLIVTFFLSLCLIECVVNTENKRMRKRIMKNISQNESFYWFQFGIITENHQMKLVWTLRRKICLQFGSHDEMVVMKHFTRCCVIYLTTPSD